MKKAKSVTVFLIGCILIMLAAVAAKEESTSIKKPTKKEKWVDPGDMLNFDYVSKTYRKKKSEENESEDVVEQGSCTAELSELKHCNESLADALKKYHTQSEELRKCKENTEDELPDVTWQETWGIKGEVQFLSDEVLQDLQHCNDLLADALKKSHTQSEELEKLKKKESEKKPARVFEETPKLDAPLLRIFLKNFLSKLPVKVGDEDKTYNAEISLAPRDYYFLESYANTMQGNMHDANSVICNMIKTVTVYEDGEQKGKFQMFFQQMSGMTIYEAFMLACIMVSGVVIVYTVPHIQLPGLSTFKFFMVTIFLSSFLQNWYQLYLSAVVKHNARMNYNVSDQCKAFSQKSFWERATELYKMTFSFKDDSCQDYLTTVMIPPWIMANPFAAFIKTLFQVITVPLESSGGPLAKFINDTYKDLPIQGQIVVTIVLPIFLLLLIYTIYIILRLPSRAQPPTPTPQILQVQHLPVQQLPVQQLQVQHLPVQHLPVQQLPVQQLPVQPVQQLPVQPVQQQQQRQSAQQQQPTSRPPVEVSREVINPALIHRPEAEPEQNILRHRNTATHLIEPEEVSSSIDSVSGMSADEPSPVRPPVVDVGPSMSDSASFVVLRANVDGSVSSSSSSSQPTAATAEPSAERLDDDGVDDEFEVITDEVNGNYQTNTQVDDNNINNT